MDARDFQYCPLCGDSLNFHREDEVKAPFCVKCQRIFYSSPHPTVSAIVVDEDEEQVLLTRRKIDPMKGYWDIPGGFLDLDESLEDGLRREIREELGIEIQIKRIIGNYPDTYGSEATPTINVFYLVTITKGKPSPRSDVLEAQWFQRDVIPKNIAFDNGRRALEEWKTQCLQGK